MTMTRLGFAHDRRASKYKISNATKLGTFTATSRLRLTKTFAHLSIEFPWTAFGVIEKELEPGGGLFIIIGKRHYFFFQAEDGIRGPLVTGVQTCALPICELGATTAIMKDSRLSAAV